MMQSSAESIAFRKCYGVLCSGIQTPKSLIPQLYSDDVLTMDKREELMRQPQPTSLLLDVVEKKIMANPKVFHDFVRLLEKERVMQELCNQLNKAYGEEFYNSP